jgi:hypothetical protein
MEVAFCFCHKSQILELKTLLVHIAQMPSDA